MITTQQLRKAFPGDGTEPRFLLLDNDASSGRAIAECVRRLIRQSLPSAKE